MICDYCNKSFYKEGNQYKKWEHQFCSRYCQKHYYREHNERWIGENSPRWQGGCDLDERTRFMQTPKYREWRKSVFKRDNFTCQICQKKKSGRLNAHHIKSYRDFPDLRLEVNNGITLCNECHRKLHSNKIELDIQSELTQ